MTDVDPRIPRVGIALLAVVAVALAAGGVPFDDRGPDPGRTGEITPVDTPETPTPAAEPSPFSWLSAATPYLFGGTVGVLALFAAALVYRAFSGSAPPDASEPDRDPGPPDVPSAEIGAVGAAAGRAADRLQRDGTLDNEVYRAWKEMTDGLRVANRPARTPGEFADAAERAGMSREDVRDLTALFESVRYGTDEPTAADERRAIELLRRIESRYGADRA